MRLNKSKNSKFISAILFAKITFFSSSDYFAAATEKSLIVGRYAPVESLDIANVWDVSVYTADQIFEPLYIVGKDGQPQPWLNSCA